MINSNSELKQKNARTQKNIVDLIVAVVHNKIFPTIVVVLAMVIAYPLVLIGPGTFFMKLAFVVISIPAFIAFALYIYGLSDLAPSLHELYKRFKREFSPDKNDD